MADVSEKVPVKDAATAISQGKRHLLVRDYNLAVIVLAQACELLVQEHGETGDEMGELYLLYGRALLGLAREEAGVLGGGVPGSEEVNQDEIEEEEDDEESEEGSVAEGGNNTESRVEKSSSSCTLNGNESDNQESIPKNGNEDSKDTKDGEKPEEEVDEEKVDLKPNKTLIDNKNEEKVDKKKKMDTQIDMQDEVASCSRYSNPHNNEASSSKNQRKEDEETDAEEEEDVEEKEGENEEDDVNNLQIAWEVLELAKLVLVKRGSSGWKFLAEAHRLLGEVAMESGNHDSAMIDFKACLNLLEKMTPRDHRAIAEIYYQLGLAHAMANSFDVSIEQFNQATALLEAKIVHLKTVEDNNPLQSDDPFYTVEGEIKELQDLLPEIQEKIADIKDLKKEADVIKEIKEEALNGCSNDEANEASGSGSAVSKPASDITHLVRKKRKAENEENAASPCKKTMQEKDVA